MNDTKYWLWLSMIFGSGNPRLWEAMCYFATAREAYFDLTLGYLDDRLDPQELRNIRNTDINKAAELIAYCENEGIGVIGYEDSEYPQQLKHIYNPPAVLFYKGDISCLSAEMMITSVGARKALPYSVKTAENICRELAGNGVVIVSGFAVGVDIASHLGAVSVNSPTVCVMGCGVDVDYPRENFRYRKEILSSGGVFISEFPPGTPPYSPNFPKRNRILSALSSATVIFEASMKSGSLITATLALEQGRDVFCLPPANIFSSSFSGNVAFLRDGASAFYSSDDIMQCFDIDGYDSYSSEDTAEKLNAEIRASRINKHNKLKNNTKIDINKKADVKSEHKAEKNTVNNTIADKQASVSKISETLTPVQKRITELLSGCSLHADIISQKLGLDSAELMTELTELEILGIIKSLPGKMFEISI